MRFYMCTPIATPDWSDLVFRWVVARETIRRVGESAVNGLCASYATGELAPVGGEYQIVGHEIPANARCVSRRMGATIEVLKNTPLPSCGPCGRGALWRLKSAGSWWHNPQRYAEATLSVDRGTEAK